MKREPGIDLLRCMGLFFVNGVHMFLKNGFYGEPQMGATVWGADCFRWLFFTCNGIFLMLTGYLKSTKPFTRDYYKSLIPILLGYALTCLITYPIRHFALGEVLTAGEWLNNFLTFSNYAWYIEMYIGLLLFSPILNLAMAHMEDWQLLGIAGIMFSLSALPSLASINLIPDYWAGLYPMTFYMLGAVVRRWQPKVKLWQGLAYIAFLVMFMGWKSLIATDEAFSEGFTQGNGGFWNSLVTIGIFVTFYKVDMPGWAAKVLAFLSPGVMEGYLLSIVLDRSMYALHPEWNSPELYPIQFVRVTIPIFLISLIAGRAVHEIAARLSRLLTKKPKGDTIATT